MLQEINHLEPPQVLNSSRDDKPAPSDVHPYVRPRYLSTIKGHETDPRVSPRAEMAALVQEEASAKNHAIPTMVHKPFDPNLVCPMCGKKHRIGEIQKFRVHVDTCEGD